MDAADFLDSVRTHTSELEILFRLTLAGLFGAAIGIDRELRSRPAGLRTNTLTALAAALFTVLTIELTYQVSSIGGDVVRSDPVRVIEAVTAGVAFLAAGAIIRSRGHVKGLTTGAGMWLAGAIGVACGGGFYAVAVMGVVLALIVLRILMHAEKRGVLHPVSAEARSGRTKRQSAAGAGPRRRN